MLTGPPFDATAKLTPAFSILMEDMNYPEARHKPAPAHASGRGRRLSGCILYREAETSKVTNVFGMEIEPGGGARWYHCGLLYSFDLQFSFWESR
jgi:hypothetical protein